MEVSTPDNWNSAANTVIGCDVGFGPSKFGVVVLQYVDGKIRVIYNEEYQRESFAEVVSKIWDLTKKRNITVSNIYVDGSRPEFIDALNREFDQSAYKSSWNYIHDKIAYCKKHNLNIEDYLFVVPVNFNQENKTMIPHVRQLLDDPDNLIQIHPKFDMLLTALRTAVSNEDKLDKTVTSYADSLDAFRMALKYWRYSK